MVLQGIRKLRPVPEEERGKEEESQLVVDRFTRVRA
jgi:hypothetical protein